MGSRLRPDITPALGRHGTHTHNGDLAVLAPGLGHMRLYYVHSALQAPGCCHCAACGRRRHHRWEFAGQDSRSRRILYPCSRLFTAFSALGLTCSSFRLSRISTSSCSQYCNWCAEQPTQRASTRPHAAMHCSSSCRRRCCCCGCLCGARVSRPVRAATVLLTVPACWLDGIASVAAPAKARLRLRPMAYRKPV